MSQDEFIKASFNEVELGLFSWKGVQSVEKEGYLIRGCCISSGVFLRIRLGSELVILVARGLGRRDESEVEVGSGTFRLRSEEVLVLRVQCI
jgi:hypothetical protein